jgi:hypothetical protein
MKRDQNHKKESTPIVGKKPNGKFQFSRDSMKIETDMIFINTLNRFLNGILLVALAGLVSLKASAFEPPPSWAWAVSGGTTNYSGCGNHGVAVDCGGNIWICGAFSGFLPLPAGGGISGYKAGLLMELDSTGNIVGATSGSQGVANAIALDSKGQPVIAGAASGANSFFVAKYDTGENQLWLQTTSTGSISPQALAVDSSDDVLVTGSYENSCTLGKYQFPSVGSYVSAPFVAKLSGSTGAVIWALTFSASGFLTGGNGIATDVAGNVYVTGVFENSSINLQLWPSGSVTLSNPSGGPPYNTPQMFLLKFDTAGHLLGAVQSLTDNSSYSAIGEDVAVDSFGHVYVTGQLLGAGSRFLPVLPLLTTSSADTFLVQYDDQLNPRWQVGAFCSSGGQNGVPYSVKTDSFGDAFIFGTLNPDGGTGVTMTFDPLPSGSVVVQSEPVANILEAQNVYGQGFVAKYDAGGALHWFNQISSSGYGFSCVAGAVDPAANVYVGGSGYGTNQFGGIAIGSTNHTLALYIGKLGTTSPFIQVAFNAQLGTSISWSSQATGFRLQNSTDLQHWQDDTNNVTQVDCQNEVFLDSSKSSATFYRLAY